MVQKVTSSILVSHPIKAGIVQWLVCKFSKLEMRVQFSLPAPTRQRMNTCIHSSTSAEGKDAKHLARTSTHKKRGPIPRFLFTLYFGSNKNATVPAAAPKIIVIIIVTINPARESFSGLLIIVTGPVASSFGATTFF